MKKEIFEELLSSVQQPVAIERGELKPGRVFTVKTKTDVARARARLGLSQEKFAALLGISPAALRNWEEQGRREPNGAAKVLRKVAMRHPRVDLEAAA